MKTTTFRLTVTDPESLTVPNTDDPSSTQSDEDTSQSPSTDTDDSQSTDTDNSQSTNTNNSQSSSTDTNSSRSSTTGSDSSSSDEDDVFVPNTGYYSSINETSAVQGGLDVGAVISVSLIAAVVVLLAIIMMRCKKRAKVGFGKMGWKGLVGVYALLGLAIVLVSCGIGKVVDIVNGEVKAADFNAFSVSNVVEVNVELDEDEPVEVCGTANVAINEDLANGYAIKVKVGELQLISDNSVKIPSLTTAGNLLENTWGYRLKGSSTMNPIPTTSFVSAKDIETAVQSGNSTDIELCVMLNSNTRAGTYESNIAYEVEPHTVSDPTPDPSPDPDPTPNPDPITTTSDLPIQPIYESSVDVPCDSRTLDKGVAEGYSNGTKVMIRLCAVPNMTDTDGSPIDDDYIVVNSRVSGAFYAFNEAHKARYGNYLVASEGFRTNAEQQYFYNCYITGSCNGGNVAAAPGYSNHQMGLAIDFSVAGFYNGNTDLCEWAGSGCHLSSSFLSEFGLRDGRSFGENWHIEATNN